MKGIYRSPAVVIILSLVTCGIYGFYWIYVMSREINNYLGRNEDSPGLELLLCIITCGIYTIYWVYKYAMRASDAKVAAGLPPENNGIVCLILALFGLFIVDMALIQDTMNRVWETA